MKDFNTKIALIKKLVDTFEYNIEQYKANYKEASTRSDFIDRFFECLDWDVRNTENLAEQYRQVKIEDKVVIQGKPKAPDYSFRVYGQRKFFVEAKKPAVDIYKDKDSAFQVRRYGYTAKLPLSILTNFEGFAVYDTRIKPNKNDNASVARISYYTYKEYVDKFEEIYDLFSINSILKGSFDKFVIETKKKKGTSEVDKEFLKVIDEWRLSLARNIALRNKDLSIENLNYAIQKIIDRIIFLRIAEDRKTETYKLLGNIADKENNYALLDKIFKKAFKKYNSSIFQPETFISKLNIDDKVFKSIINDMYYPECPYEFSVLPIEILGNIYEQFLGKTIRLTPSHQAKIEDKPEVKKAGGVYYTPQYIVDYIVENTVGEKLKDLASKSTAKKKYVKPEDIQKLTILDPSCGSGSFLIVAYDYLLKYHLDYYTANKTRIGKAKKEGRIAEIELNEYKLTIKEKQDILRNNIFGVDIDRQAVEVTKLSLLLKLMEDEQEERFGHLFNVDTTFRLLPDLSTNIKCGNSLIGSDFYDTQDMSLIDDSTMRKVNAFDWNDEFKDIMANGGFDVVIGNPPYVKYENLNTELKNYSKIYYKCASSFFDIFQLFFERFFKFLNKNGLLGYIFPNLFLKGMNYRFSRKYFTKKSKIEIIRNYGDSVFEKVKMPTCIMILRKVLANSNIIKYYRKVADNFIECKVNQDSFNEKNNYIFTPSDINHSKSNIVDINTVIDVTRGLEIGRNKIIKRNEKQQNNFTKVIFGQDISRYLIKNISLIDDKTYEVFRKSEYIFKNDKIIIRETGNQITATYDNTKSITNRSLYCIRSNKINLKFLLSILNSTYIQYIYINKYKSETNIFPKIRIGQLKQLPIPKIDLSNKQDKASHDRLVLLVGTMLGVQEQLHNAKTESDKKLYQKKADIIDKQIDTIVYKLYDLTNKEIEIIENSL